MNKKIVIEEYTRRLKQREKKATALTKKSALLSNARLAVFLIIIGLCIVAYLYVRVSFFWILLPLMLFMVLVVLHDRVLTHKKEALLAKEYYQQGLNRINSQWAGHGVTRTDFVDENHPFALDLDLFGKGSLFELLCTSKTTFGEETLAAWLSSPCTDVETIRGRQKAVDAFRERLDLREEIYLLGGETRHKVRPATLSKWAFEPPIFKKGTDKLLRALAFGLGAAGVAGVVLAFTTKLGLLVLVGVALVDLVVGKVLQKRLDKIVKEIVGPNKELLSLSRVLHRLEKEKSDDPVILGFQKQLALGSSSAGQAIAKLGKQVAWLEQGYNQFFAPFAFLLLWKLHFGLSIEKWRLNHGKSIDGWLGALGELDALLSLSCYAYEHPGDPFATFETEGLKVEGEAMGHPLLPDDVCVPNSIHLDDTCRLWVISGSNMSGKSTFLRVVGINTILALIGAPVRAKALTLSPVALGSTIRIQDSLMAGKSRFYAEISTLKQLLDLTEKPVPLLFLLDEILHGTNSHDRQIGADAVVKSLLDKGAIGLVTTHDLALAKTAQSMGENAKNVHFSDSVEEGKLVFDYIMKQGIVQKSNALDLMRSVGLKV